MLYVCGEFQGGFAKCYELTDSVTKQVFAGKIVPKSLLVKPHQREKVLVHFLLSIYCTFQAMNTFFSLRIEITGNEVVYSTNLEAHNILKMQNMPLCAFV